MKTIRLKLFASTLWLAAASAFADSGTWKAMPANGDWNTATNWTPNTVPNAAADTASFGTSNTTAVSISADIQVNGIVFNAGASAFTITCSVPNVLAITGTGITNNSGVTQNFVAAVVGGSRGVINFSNNATAGTQTVFTSNGATTAGEGGATTQFQVNSTAGNAHLIASGGTNGGGGGGIVFRANSTGGTARVEVFGNGFLDIGTRSNPGVTIGSLAGTGNVFLGARDLTVGSNNAPTTFSGVLQDGGITPFPGGSLTKIGPSTLTLSGANTYTGSTTVSGGTLEAAAAGALGGTSGIIVNNGGTLLLSNTATTNRINNSATVKLAGGTIAFTGNVTEASSPGTGALTLTANSIIDFGGGNAVMNFGASGAGNPNPWTAAATLSIYNWAGSPAGGGNDQLIFGSTSDSTSLTAQQLAQISFYDGGPGSNFLGTGQFAGSFGEVVPVPEAATYLAGTLALAALAVSQGRRLRRGKRRR